MRIVQIILLISAAILVACAAAKACISRWGGNFKKLCIIGCTLSALAIIASICLHGIGMRNIQTILLCGIFLYASYGDAKVHEADDIIHILVLAVSLLTMKLDRLPECLLSAALMGGTLMLTAVLLRGSGVGGADMKFAAACAFLFPLFSGLMGLLLGCFAAMILNPPFRDKEGEKKWYAMLPYLSCSFMLVFLLS